MAEKRYVCNKFLAISPQGASELYHEPEPECRIVEVYLSPPEDLKKRYETTLEEILEALKEGSMSDLLDIIEREQRHLNVRVLQTEEPQKKPQTEKNFPTNLDECFQQLTELSTEEQREEYKNLDERACIAEFHHSLGRNLRNGWGLWGDSLLAGYFRGMGIHHADDMSGIIMTSYHRHLNGKDLDIEGQVKYYRDYWTRMGRDPDDLR